MKKSINIGSDCSGVGAFIQALDRLGIEHKEEFACDFDYYARITYVTNYGTDSDIEIANSKEHKKHCDRVKKISFLDRELTEEEENHLIEANKFAKEFSFYFPFNMYQRDVPDKPLDVYVSSVPCQAFSLAGKRKGESDKRGVLFYNSHEFIQKNKPRYFIFENVKGLLSDNNGKTFKRWVDLLGGKSVNGNPVLFPEEDAVPYHIYYKVLNAKHYGIPQNRERIFIVGIRDDSDNVFRWPKEKPLVKRLKDVLENDVPEKYFLSDKMLNYLHHRSGNFNNGKINFKGENDIGSCITKSSSFSLDISDNIICLGNVHPSGNGMNGNVYDSEGISLTLLTNKGEGIKIKSATKQGFEIAHEGDSINLSNPNSETRRGRVGKEVAQTLDTACNQAVYIGGRIIGRNPENPENPKSRKVGLPTEQRLEINYNGTSNALTTVQKDNVVVIKNPLKGKTEYGWHFEQNVYSKDSDITRSIMAGQGSGSRAKVINNYQIRRLTPRECFRLMDFPDTFMWPVSDSQAYKQAGNSICVGVLSGIIDRLINK